MEDIAVKIDDLSKTFKIPHERFSTLKQHALNLFNKNKTYTELHALKDISFEIKKGEFFGIIGRNGCGKSTLLKVIAQIYTPTSGKVIVNGQISPFIELGVGFNPELTARDNVYLNGALLGLSKKEVDAKFDQIFEFAELKNFVDQRLKNFSSGMQVRLGFSLAIMAYSDILLLDEVLAVGDANFQEKCMNVFEDLKKQKKTIIFVSHDAKNIRRFCDKVALIEEGRLVMVGEPEKCLNKYTEILRKAQTLAPKIDKQLN